MKTVLSALLAGLLFGAGLTVSTMTDPLRVLAFLDIFGQWDPTLAFVMGGALCVYLPAYQFIIKPRNQTLLNSAFHIPQKSRADARLVAGAILFGIGWGLAGICPGPALTNLTGDTQTILYFVLPMLAGLKLSDKWL